MINFLLKIVLCVDDHSGPVAETSHHTSVYVGQTVGLELEIPVRVGGLPVDRDIQAAILCPSALCVEEWQYPIFFLLHSEFDGRPDHVEMLKEFFN